MVVQSGQLKNRQVGEAGPFQPLECALTSCVAFEAAALAVICARPEWLCDWLVSARIAERRHETWIDARSAACTNHSPCGASYSERPKASPAHRALRTRERPLRQGPFFFTPQDGPPRPPWSSGCVDCERESRRPCAPGTRSGRALRFRLENWRMQSG